MAPQDDNKSYAQLLQDLDLDLRYGKMIARPLEGEGLVISGMAGRFPESDDVYQYRDNLINKTDMVTSDNRRWKSSHSEIPQRTGKINFIEKFDSGFFGIHSHQIHAMDPVGRLLLERSFEAVLDAGIHPDELRGTRTGVFTAACIAESEKSWFYKNLTSPNFGGSGCMRSLQANWISHFFQLEGPSVSVDTACSSSLTAVDLACKSIRLGKCDAAIVGSGNLCMHPMSSLQFFRLGVLSSDGSCKSFDKDADGYARSEAVSMIFIQKAKDARRIYANIIHTKVNCDGYKEHGITYPSGTDQKRLLSELYHECNVEPSSIDFLEAHATGTKVGDPEEITAMDQIYCQNRKEPLHVGSVKSNHGHTEPVSGLCSVTKVLLSMENDCFLPNISYSTPRLEPLLKKRMVVVTEPLRWVGKSGLAAINNFGFGGANAHVLLKKHSKIKKNKGVPQDDLPRLVCFSGRTEEAVESFRSDVSQRPLDAEFIALLHAVFAKPIRGHSHRGFSILTKTEEILASKAWYNEIPADLHLVLGGPSEELFFFISSICQFSVFLDIVSRIQNALPVEIELLSLFTSEWNKSNVNQVAAAVFGQLALIEFFKLMELKLSRVDGYFIGTISAAYAEGVLSLDEAVVVAHHVIEILREYDSNRMALQVHLGRNVIRTILPNNFDIIGHDSDRNYVIQGPEEKVKQFAEHLKTRGVTVSKAKHVEVYRKHKNEISNNLLERLRSVVKSPQRFIDDFFKTPKMRFPNDSVILRSDFLVDCLDNRYVTVVDANTHFLEVFGRLYELGFNPKLERLYPKVQWPVSAGTPMISPLIKWNHKNDWFVAYFKVQENVETGESSIMFSAKETDWVFVSGHVIDNRNLLPATGYLYLVWETFSMLQESSIPDCSVVFQNIRFHRATNLSKDHSIKLFITIQRKTGVFEVAELGQVIVSGMVYCNKSAMTSLPTWTGESDDIQLSKKDIYKELKLRGYNYSGLFRGLESCDLNITKGEIEWNGNWTAFMDNMLQLKILQVDTRGLYVPTYIDQLSINTDVHKTLLETGKIPAYVDKNADIIRCGGVEIKGLRATAIAKRKSLGEPVLETYQFVPLVTKLTLENSIRVNAQIILENNLDFKFKAVELLDDAAEPVTPILQEVLGDQPLIQPDLLLLTNKPLVYDRVTVKDKKLSSEPGEHLLVIGSQILSHAQLLHEALDAVKDNGFVLTREKLDFHLNHSNLNILTTYTTDQEKIILFQKNLDFKKALIVDLSNAEDFEWLPVLQKNINDNNQLLLVCQNDAQSGVLGLVNCLRREPYAQKPKCVFIVDKDAPCFDVNNKCYAKHLQKGLCINVYKNGCWGTYRHLLMEQNKLVKREHVFNNVLTTGDLSSLTWLEGPLKSTTKIQPEKTLVNITYSALNFRDIMTASGRIHGDVITSNRVEQQILQGFEFSGTLPNGERVMGLVKSGALSSMAVTNTYMITKIPDQWSFEEAATVTVTYFTTLYSLEEVGRLKRGQSILIHAGSGGIGISAINIALHYKCNIFTTVGTLEKKKYILDHFPEIPESHVGNSRDTSFEQMVMKETRGRGVDLVLNSLAEEKLQASVRCLAPRGKFLEIGKFDLQNNNKLKASTFASGCSYHSVMLDMFFDETPARQRVLLDLLMRGIKDGYVKPLKRTVFEKTEIEQAFRYMAGGKHIGKVLVKIRDEGEEKLFEGLPRFYCNEENSSVIVGGLGGFGLELADWLIMRGCKKLVLVSRSGLKNGYEASKIQNWKKYGVTTLVSTVDVTRKEGCVRLLKDANKLGAVECIFNLAVVLKDAVLENQTKSNFEISFGPKAIATRHLDDVSRRLCPGLKKFVVFSSVVCGRGNAGQSNYGMANSVMERICEQRQRDGYPGLAIQWGAVGDVGLVADMQELQQEIEIGGTLQQRITSCLSVMDTFLNQDQPVVSSVVVAEKKGSTTGSSSVIDAVMNIIGIKDLKSVGIHTSLSQLGMDSIMAVEIKQTLEREYEAIVTPQDIRALTFAMLQDMESEKSKDEPKPSRVKHDSKYDMLHLFVLNVADEVEEFAPVVRLKSLVPETTPAPCVFVLPGVDGKSKVIEPLAVNLACHVFCVQYDNLDPFQCTVENTAKDLMTQLQECVPEPAPFIIIAYSLSCVAGLELVSLLEERGRIGRLILLDGSPKSFDQLIRSQVPDITDESVLQSYIIGSFAKSYLTLEQVLKIKPDLLQCTNLEERIDHITKYLPNPSPTLIEYQKKIIRSGYGRVRSVAMYKPKLKKLKTPITLIKPEQQLLPDFSDDYDLQSLCHLPVQIHTFEGNHLTVLKSLNLAATINAIVSESWQHAKDGGVLTDSLIALQRAPDLTVKQI